MKLSPDFSEALVYAAQLHSSQLRKGTEVPYVAHLLAVAGLVLEYGGTEDEAIAALLHDAVEDQGGRATLDRIRRRFGSDVADIVESCRDTDVEPKPAWRQRKEEYLQHLAQASRSAKLVSAADKLHNATAILRDYRTFGEAIWSRFKGGMEGTLWNYRALVQAYGTMENHAIVRDLDRVVTELEATCEHLRPESLGMKGASKPMNSKTTPTKEYVPQFQKILEARKNDFLYSLKEDLESVAVQKPKDPGPPSKD